jgi:hypothetical protein
MIRGEASDNRETFVFTISPFVTGGFRLDIRYSGDGPQNITGAGVWPTIEKAKQIAQETAARLLQEAIIIWHQD